MTGIELAEFMKKRRINLSEMARKLGISRARLRRMIGNEVPIPSWCGLACAAIAWGLPAWGSGIEPRETVSSEDDDGALVIKG